MNDKKKFVKPELVKFDKPLDEVTMNACGTGCVDMKPVCPE